MSRLTSEISGVKVEYRETSLSLYFVPINYQDNYYEFPLGEISRDPEADSGVVFDMLSYSKARKKIILSLKDGKPFKLRENNPIGKKLYIYYGKALGKVINFLSVNNCKVRITDKGVG